MKYKDRTGLSCPDIQVLATCDRVCDAGSMCRAFRPRVTISQQEYLALLECAGLARSMSVGRIKKARFAEAVARLDDVQAPPYQPRRRIGL